MVLKWNQRSDNGTNQLSREPNWGKHANWGEAKRLASRLDMNVLQEKKSLWLETRGKGYIKINRMAKYS